MPTRWQRIESIQAANGATQQSKYHNSRAQNRRMSATNATPLEVTCQELKRKLDAKADLLLLDCREPDEHELVRMAGSLLLPMSELMARAEELAPHKNREIVVHCHHGGRSLRVTHWLRNQGFAHVSSLAGGIDQWAAEIDPSLPRY